MQKRSIGHSKSGHGPSLAPGTSLNRVALSATVHCLTGCAIGEVLGMVIGTALAWTNAATIALSVVLAFFFGYALTMIPLIRSGIAFKSVMKLAFAADTVSIAIMEFVVRSCLLFPEQWMPGWAHCCFGEVSPLPSSSQALWLFLSIDG